MSSLIPSTPRKDNFRMPAEFAPHAGTYLIWPEWRRVWREKALPAQKSFVELVNAIAEFEPVTVGVNPESLEFARAQLPKNIRVLALENNDAWARDTGPTFVVDENGARCGIEWQFNAWGEVYDDPREWERDKKVARKICEFEKTDFYSANFVLEGGAIHTDGEGALLTTEECLLNPNRNPHLTRTEIEERLREYLNVEKIIWLPRGIAHDETSGHIDNIACFVRPGVVVLAFPENEEDPQFPISRESYEILTHTTDARGRKLEVHKLPLPAPQIVRAEEIATLVGEPSFLAGTRMAASYVNFYVCNGGVIVPVFEDSADATALKKLAELFPERKIVPISAREFLLGGGNIHCLTQQIPRGRIV